MSFAHNYIKKNKIIHNLSFAPNKNLNIIVVIPCYDEDNLIDTLTSILKADSPKNSIEVITIINSSTQTPSEIVIKNRKTLEQAHTWCNNHNSPQLQFYFINEENLPSHKAGVGLARKIGMDIAISRFNEINNPSGIIASLDADTKIASNYFTEIEKTYLNDSKTTATNIYFEHPISGEQYSKHIYKGIALYELHLRYYLQSLRYAKFPHAQHTIGSAFTVKASTYIKQGGMNTKKAGEDFYFLQKVIPTGVFRNIATTMVIPSPRTSDRVPFGTGKAQIKYLQSLKQQVLTYDTRTFTDLKEFFSKAEKFFDVIKQYKYEQIIKELPKSICTFLQKDMFYEQIKKLNQNTKTIKTYKKNFFGNVFNAFKTVKYVNYASQHYYPKISITKAANQLLKIEQLSQNYIEKPEQLLQVYRHIEKTEKQ